MNLLNDVLYLKKRDEENDLTWYNYFRHLSHLGQKIEVLKRENKELKEIVYNLGKRIQKLEEAKE